MFASLGALSHCGAFGTCRAFRSSAPHSRLKGVSFAAVARGSPPLRPSLAPSTFGRRHARARQAAKPPLRFAPSRAVSAPSFCSAQGARFGFRSAQIAVAGPHAPRPALHKTHAGPLSRATLRCQTCPRRKRGLSLTRRISGSVRSGGAFHAPAFARYALLKQKMGF